MPFLLACERGAELMSDRPFEGLESLDPPLAFRHSYFLAYFSPFVQEDPSLVKG